MEIVDFLKKLREENIGITLNGENLQIHSDIPQIPSEFIDQIREKKTAIIAYLHDQENSKESYSSISNVAQADYYPVSNSQKRLWILSQFEDSNIAYNLSGFYQFNGELNKEFLAEAFLKLIDRHEILRTVFQEQEDGEVAQVVLHTSEINFRLSYDDISEGENKNDLIRAIVQDQVEKNFDLATGPLLRATLIKIEEGKYLFGVVIHHIICDDWSIGIIVKETLTLYNSCSNNEEALLQPLSIQYKDYASWQQEQMKNGSFKADREYWMSQFAGEVPVLEILGDRKRPSIKSFKGEKVNHRLKSDTFFAFKKLGQDQESTLFMSLLASVNVLLYKYSGQSDIVVGSAISGRERAELQDQIGFYLNTLALRTRFSGEHNFLTLLEEVKKTTLEAFEHKNYPFDALITDLELRRDMSRSPLFDVMVDIRNADSTDSDSASLNEGDSGVQSYTGSENQISKFDLTFSFSEEDGELVAALEYNSDIFDESTAERLLEDLERLIQAIIKTPTASIDTLDYLSKETIRLLTEGFNDTKVEDQNEVRSIVRLFEEQVLSTPDNIAVSFEGKKLTYNELNVRSNQLADYLVQNQSIQKNDLVGIRLKRSELLIVTILGVLKSGAAYMPIDSKYSKERINYLMEDSKCKLVFDDDEFLQFNTVRSKYNKHNPKHIIANSDLAYILYTSGSTGNPKGVMIEHKALYNYVKWASSYYFKENEESNFGLFTSLSFDLTVTSLFVPLMRGGLLEVMPDSTDFLAEIRTYFRENSPLNAIKLTPSHLRVLLDEKVDLKGIQKIILGGEELTEKLLMRLKAQNAHVEIFNEYGPTETTVGCTVELVHSGEGSVSIGKPIANTQVYILGKKMELLPIGVAGEICIGGNGVARGYLNNEALTAEKFVVNPYREGTFLYKTGDLGTWQKDGSLKYIGRTDDQVKINGFRIELGEIESRLMQLEMISEATVVAKKTENDNTVLIAYIISDVELNSTEIRIELKRTLVEYMIPSHYVQLEQFPLTVNGKIDKKALPNPDGIGMSTGIEYVAPSNETEKTIIEIWEDILGKEKIGRYDNFFDLGGDSIKNLRMISALKKARNVSLSISDIYKYNTVELLGKLINDSDGGLDSRNEKFTQDKEEVKAEIEKLKQSVLASGRLSNADNVEDIYPMSDIEKGMIFSSLFMENGVYHDQFVYRKTFAGFDIERFRKAISLMIGKHSIMRTNFFLNEFETEIQVVNKSIEYSIPYTDISHLSEEEIDAVVEEFLDRELAIPYDFGKEPLWRMSVYNIGRNKMLFVYQFHHAISDGWSTSSFLTELNNIYLELEEDPDFIPVPMKSSYKDFIIQSEIDRKNDSSRNYWKEELSSHKRLDIFTEDNTTESFTHTQDTAFLKQVEKAAAEMNTTVKILSLSVYLYLLKVLNHDNEILAGVLTNTRPVCEDSDKIIGCFLNTLPFRTVIDESLTSREYVKQINDKIIEQKEFESLSLIEIAQLHNEKSASGNPFFDVLFGFIDFHIYNEIGEDTTSAEGEEEDADSKGNVLGGSERANTFFDLHVSTTGNNYVLALHLTKKLKMDTSLEKLGALYFNVLNHLMTEKDTRLEALSNVSKEEEQQLVVDFNNTFTDYAKDSTLVSLFEEQVLNNPDGEAIFYNNKSFSYAQLNEQSNQIADYLRNRVGVKPDDLVGIQLDRSEKVIMAILGVLKSGAACLPIDGNYPQERIDYMLENSNCQFVFNEDELSQFTLQRSRFSKENPEKINKISDLAYVIYTSGSTGKPKGVCVEHNGIVNTINSQIDLFKVDAKDRGLQFASFSFDASFSEIFMILLSGGALYIVSDEVKLSPDSFVDFLRDNQITVATIPPAYMAQIEISQLDGMKSLISAGEAPVISKLLEFTKYGVAYNAYGPTESSICASVFSLTADTNRELKRIPIGSPIANTEIYILDDRNRLMPIGMVGEICIGGNGVARGYLNNVELTEEKFIDNPFKKGERIYKTGDLGYWNPDGTIEFVGRKDDQVKIRGYRIEVGEIESTLLKHPMIDLGVVVVRRDENDETCLAAYFVSSEELSRVEVREFLKETLPEYMIPEHIVQLESMPLTFNGKIDKKNLPSPDDSKLLKGADYVAPDSDMEVKLVEIWETVLDRKGIGVQDNFFDVGGNSIKIMRLTKLINDEFNAGITIPILFQYPSIKDLVAYLGEETVEEEEFDREELISEMNMFGSDEE